MSLPIKPVVAVSAPGKVLLAGGYLVLDRKYTGLVFGLSARINVIAGTENNSSESSNSEIIVDSPQFLGAQWRYAYTTAAEDGGIKVCQVQSETPTSSNPFVETTLNYALTYINALSKKPITPARLVILADNDYYSQSGVQKSTGSRFVEFGVTLKDANKTGLGSSAALVTSLTATLLSYYLSTDLFDITSANGKKTLHNLAQAAHCAAQGKVGSGFDVAAAVYGSCMYRRFSPSILSSIPEAGASGFAEKLVSVIDKEAWDVEVEGEDLSLPGGVALLMCDVDCGSQTVGMVKKVLAWRAEDKEQSLQLWDDLQSRNETLASALKQGDLDSLPAKVESIRELIRKMGELSDVPIEPESQTKLLDAITKVDGVYGGVVPGAGGFDALALLVKDDSSTKARLEEFLAKWSSDTDSKVKLLSVKGEMEGAKREDLAVYEGWFA